MISTRNPESMTADERRRRSCRRAACTEGDSLAKGAAATPPRYCPGASAKSRPYFVIFLDSVVRLIWSTSAVS